MTLSDFWSPTLKSAQRTDVLNKSAGLFMKLQLRRRSENLWQTLWLLHPVNSAGETKFRVLIDFLSVEVQKTEIEKETKPVSQIQ